MDFDSPEEALVVNKGKNSKSAIIWGIIAGVTTFTTIVLAILLATSGGSPKSAETAEQNFCTSLECVSAASRILNSMDRTVDPCHDFYTYSCGKWNINHEIPDHKSSMSTFNDIRDSVSLTLKRVLEADSNGDRNAITKAKIHYASCMDTDKIDSLRGQPALELIASIGGMPLFGDKPGALNLEETLGKSVAEFGSFGLISMWVASDDMNSSVNIIQVDQPSLGMPNRDFYTHETLRNATLPGYTQYMRDYLGMLWKEKNAAAFDEKQVQLVSNQIVKLETDLANSMMKSEHRRDNFALHRKRTIREMTGTITADFDWLTYLNTALAYVDKSVTETTEIVSYGDQYFRNFTAILSKYDNSLVQNYIVWMVLRLRISFLGKEFRDTDLPYRLATSGTSKEQSRWKTCSDNANSNFLMPVGALFVEEAFSDENKRVTETIVENIRESFINSLHRNEWMDQDTKDKAERKANMIAPIIAYPDYIVDKSNTQLDDEFTDASVEEGAFFNNMQNMVEYSVRKNLRKLDVPVDRQEWNTGPAVVNALYSPSRNQIVFPAGILQPPFYDPGQPDSMNYGGIGMVIGHEITHAFDDSGSQYNGVGNLENWWTNSSRENFNAKAKCMEDQFSEFYWEEANSNLNGKLTLGENIADNGGIRKVFDAYQTWKSQNATDLLLPGLQNFTQEQLFFLAMAQIWCGTYRPEHAVRLVSTDPHSPGMHRVIGSLSNFEEFGKAYGCKKGTHGMYPNEEDTCRVW